MNLLTKTTLLLTTVLCLTSCQYSVYNVRIPLTEDPAAIFKDATHVVIDDARPNRERATHLAKEIWSCERWFGDDVFQPSRLVYLDALIGERISHTFDYGHLSYTSPNVPSSNYMYRVLLRDRMGRLADDIVRKLPKT